MRKIILLLESFTEIPSIFEEKVEMQWKNLSDTLKVKYHINNLE